MNLPRRHFADLVLSLLWLVWWTEEVDRKYGECIVCGGPFQKEWPVLEEWATQGQPIRWVWMAFFSEWPGTARRFVDPECFAREWGVGALIDAVHERDLHIREPLKRWRDDEDRKRRPEPPPDSN